MEQLEGWSELQRILLWRLHISHHHVSCKRRKGLDQELLLWERYSRYQKSYRTIDQKDSIPMSHIWNHVRHQEWPKNPGSGNKRFAGSSRGLFGRLVWRLQPVCYPCKNESPSCQEMYSSLEEYVERGLRDFLACNKNLVLFRTTHISPREDIYLKSYLSAFSTKN